MQPQTTILATTYAVNPYKGSEDGMGWNFVLQIARHQRVIAVTRENNRPHIERYMAEHPNPAYARITWVYYDLPPHQRWWKKGARGAMLYYLLWQRGVAEYIQNLGLDFDIVHNVNFHNDWSPSYLWKLGKPFVWGPVGHHPLIPVQYLRPYGWREFAKDRLTWAVKRYFWNYSSRLRQSVRHAAHIICMNRSVPQVLDLGGCSYSVAPSVAGHWPAAGVPVAKDRFIIISAGRLVPLKGFDLTIRAFAHWVRNNPQAAAGAELQIVGSGPELERLEQMALTEGVAEQVRFVAWVERDALMQMYRQASVFLFPSHEGAGMVVAEALSYGLPVVCLDNDGPGLFINDTCGIAVPMGDYATTVRDLADALTQLHDNPTLYAALAAGAQRQFGEVFEWDRRGDHLRDIYASVLGERSRWGGAPRKLPVGADRREACVAPSR